MSAVSEWQGKVDSDEYQRQRDEQGQTRTSGDADIVLDPIDNQPVHPAGGIEIEPVDETEISERRQRPPSKMVALRNRDLRTYLGLLGTFTVLLMLIVLLFMAYPYQSDEDDRRALTFISVPALDFPNDALYVGHTSPSTSSFCVAWAGSDLFGGSYALAGPPSPETQYLIDEYSFETPPQFSDVYHDEKNLVLVDHNQATQSPAFQIPLEVPNVTGIIDNHASQEVFVSGLDAPLPIDMRPWGSPATIIFYHYYQRRMKPSRSVSQCLLNAVYSDTVGLKGPTTTQHDRVAVGMLHELARVDEDGDRLTENLIDSRVPPSGTSIEDVLNIDAKTYQLSWVDGTFLTVRWSTFESGEPDYVLDRSEEYMAEMRRQKQLYSLDFYFMSVVDQLRFFKDGDTEDISTLLLPSENEKIAADRVFAADTLENGSLMDVSPLMSRKKEFIPPLDSFFRETEPFNWGNVTNIQGISF